MPFLLFKVLHRPGKNRRDQTVTFGGNAEAI